mgnify:CR=1 FL=1
MSKKHYIVFIGAQAALSEELRSLEKRFVNTVVIAPARKKKVPEICKNTIDTAQSELFQQLKSLPSNAEVARLTVWTYEPTSLAELEDIWQGFGKSAWVQKIPQSLKDKVSQTTNYIQNEIKKILPSIHHISKAIYSNRARTPLSLPLENFNSKITNELSSFWYNKLDEEEIKYTIKDLTNRLSQTKNLTKGGFIDERSLIFSPCKNGELHGLPHPTGNTCSAFINGRFRFGAAIFPGFHYDVTSKTGNLKIILKRSDGEIRDMAPEKRKNINIFPNDHLLPEK